MGKIKNFLLAASLFLCLAKGFCASRSDIFIEAESFAKKDSGWVLTHYPWGSINTPWRVYSRGFGIQAPGKASSSLNIEISKSGKYKIWMRIHLEHGGALPPFQSRSPVSLSIKQNNIVIFNGEFQGKPWDKTNYIKTNEWIGEGFGWHWFVWESLPAELIKGPAEISLSKNDPGSWKSIGWCGSGNGIDCILLTDDLLYEPKAGDFGNPVYFRIRAPENVTLNMDIRNCTTYYIYGTQKIKIDKGQTSPWLSLKGNYGPHYSYLSSDKALKCKLDFATAPEDSAIIKSFEIGSDGSAMIFKYDLPLNKTSSIETNNDLAEKRLALAKSSVPKGQAPGNLIFESSFGPGLDNKYASGTYNTELEVLHRLGINSIQIYGEKSKNAKANGIKYCRPTSEAASYYFYNDYNPCKLPPPEEIDAKNKKQLSAINKYDMQDSIYTMIFSDEVAKGKAISFYQEDPACLNAFREYLKSEGLSPEVLGAVRDTRLFYQIEAENMNLQGFEIRKKIPLPDKISGEKYIKLDLSRQDATAEKTFHIAQSGQYRIWVRYADLKKYYSENFIVSLSQGGVSKKETEFGGANKNPGHFVYESHEALLDKEDLTITIKKGKEATNEAPPCIDLLVLTNDLSYIPDIEKTVPPDTVYEGNTASWTKEDSIESAWNKIKPSDNRKNPRLYYHSMLFRRNTTTDFFKALTESTTRIMGSKCGLTPGCLHISEPLSYGNMTQLGLDWFDLYRKKGFSYLFTEDWYNSPNNIGPQDSCYISDFARAATKYNHQGMGIYEVLSYNRKNIDQDARLRFYSYLGHGQQAINFFHYGPPEYGNCCCDWPEEAYKLVGDLTHEAGTVEQWLVNSTYKKPETAILYSETGDIWRAGNIEQSERRNIYFALNHVQIPADILSTWDLLNGDLNNYKVLYITDSHLSQKETEKIKAWVRNGGRLFASAGAGYYNEYNEENHALDEVFGIKNRCLEISATNSRDKMEMLKLPSLDSITFNDRLFPDVPKLNVVAYRESFKVTTGQPTGTFNDGLVASVSNQYGKGKSFIIGGLAGIAYMNAALSEIKKWTPEYIPHNFDRGINSLITSMCKDVEKPVELNVPEIDIMLKESEHGIILTIANYTLKPVPELLVKINHCKEPTAVESLATGALKYTREGDSIIFKMPLNITDFVVLTYKKQ